MKKNLILFVVISAVLLIFSAEAGAEAYPLLQPLPGVQQPTDISDYISKIVPFILMLAAVLALVQIVIGGMEWALSESVLAKGEGKDRITQAIIGLLLALVSWLILNTINPDLVSIRLPQINNLGVAPAGGIGGAGGGGGGTAGDGVQCGTNTRCSGNQICYKNSCVTPKPTFCKPIAFSGGSCYASAAECDDKCYARAACDSTPNSICTANSITPQPDVYACTTPGSPNYKVCYVNSPTCGSSCKGPGGVGQGSCTASFSTNCSTTIR